MHPVNCAITWPGNPAGSPAGAAPPQTIQARGYKHLAWHKSPLPNGMGWWVTHRPSGLPLRTALRTRRHAIDLATALEDDPAIEWGALQQDDQGRWGSDKDTGAAVLMRLSRLALAWMNAHGYPY